MRESLLLRNHVQILDPTKDLGVVSGDRATACAVGLEFRALQGAPKQKRAIVQAHTPFWGTLQAVREA